MDAIRAALSDLAQSATSAGARVQQSPEAQFRADAADVYEKLNKATQGILLFINTEQDRIDQRLQGYISGAGQHVRDKSVMDHKIVQNLGKVTGDKAKFRQWNHKFRSALMTVDMTYDNVLEVVEKDLNFGTPMDDIDNKVKGMINGTDYGKLTRDLYCILIDKAEDEA